MIWSELPSDHKFPEHMPVHPQGHFGKVGLDHVFDNVLTPWAIDRTLDGGGHGIIKDSLNKATELGDRGARQNVKCESYGPPPAPKAESKRSRASKKCNCPFWFVMEESSEGWLVSRMHCGLVPFEQMHGSFHNHTLTQTQPQANAAPGGKQRQIPADLKIIGAAMADVHQRAGSIYDTLARMCKKDGRPVTFDQSDIRNEFAATTAARASDAMSLIKALKDREQLKGLGWDFSVDKDEGLTRVWWELKARPIRSFLCFGENNPTNILFI